MFRSLEPTPLPIRYERENPGELLHLDTKRLGRFDRAEHRVTRKRSFGSPRQGFEFLYVAAASRFVPSSGLLGCRSSSNP